MTLPVSKIDFRENSRSASPAIVKATRTHPDGLKTGRSCR
jgi:hypothetical protein